MKNHLFAIVLLTILASSVSADEILLPVFAFNMPGGNGTAWSSEVYVTNPGTESVTAVVGIFLPGKISNTPPCLPLLQPFLIVPPKSTVVWNTGDLSLGIGCPEFAVGGLMFHSEGPVYLTSRMVRHTLAPNGDVRNPLSGLGQEIDGVDLRDLPKGASRMILPAVGWHPNSCGPSLLDTNVFFTNPESTAVRVEIDAPPGLDQLMVDGQVVEAPYSFELDARSQRVIRLAGPGSPMLPVCLEPVIGSFTFSASGTISAIASIIDRQSGDPRTAPALPVD